VLFVCLGNICRSPTAEGVFRAHAARAGLSARFEIDSAGTSAFHVGEPPDPRTQAAALRRGHDLSGQRARAVAAEDFGRFDLLVAMDQRNLAVLERARPAGSAARLGLLLDWAPQLGVRDVPDPYSGGEAGFERVLDLVEAASEGLLEALRREL
jgi:protein-tyrosine phosphatase